MTLYNTVGYLTLIQVQTDITARRKQLEQLEEERNQELKRLEEQHKKEEEEASCRK